MLENLLCGSGFAFHARRIVQSNRWRVYTAIVELRVQSDDIIKVRPDIKGWMGFFFAGNQTLAAPFTPASTKFERLCLVFGGS